MNRNRNIYFTPGPSELYFTVENHVRTCLKSHILSISHRSAEFKSIFKEAVENLRTLLNLPDDLHIVFTASATEIWERIIQNTVEYNSAHLVNGAFSRRFYETANQFNIDTTLLEAPEGQVVDPKEAKIPESCELIGITHNETSTGASQPLGDIEFLKNQYPSALITVDAVSSIPYPDFNYESIDSIYFSVQKCFGLPAGLGVWIVNNRMIEKTTELELKGKITGSYHRLKNLVDKGKDHQTPETPNVFGLYLLSKVTNDFLVKGLDQIRRETEYKAALLYHTLEEIDWIRPFVDKVGCRSKTVIVGEVEFDSGSIINFLKKHGLIIGNGYGRFKNKHIRIANFPTHSREQTERLCDLLTEFTP